MKMITIPAHLRLYVSDDVTEQQIKEMVSIVSSDTVPTLENIQSELDSHAISIGQLKIPHESEPDVWVDKDGYEVLHDL